MIERSDESALGPIDIVTLGDAPALSLDVPDEPTAIAEAWPAFVARFDDTSTRMYMGLHDPSGTYRLSSILMDAAEDEEGLTRTVLPGGQYMRLRLRAEAASDEGIREAFAVLFAQADRDETRPHIEYFRGPGQVDCLVPIRT